MTSRFSGKIAGGIPTPTKDNYLQVIEALRAAAFNHEQRLKEKEQELRTLQALLRAQTAASDGVVLLDEDLPAFTTYQMRQHPNHVLFVFPELPFIVTTTNPTPQKAFAQLFRGLDDDDSTVLDLVAETQGMSLQDHPPARIDYRYFLRLRSADYTRIGPLSPREGIAFRNVETNPEAVLPRSEGGVFLETFDARDLLTKWAAVTSPPNPVIDFPENGQFGGIVARIAGAAWFGVHRDLIPFDPGTLYRMTVGVKRTAVVGGGELYAGVIGVAADGETLISRIGTNEYGHQHDIAAFAATPAVGTYAEFVGYFKGLGAHVGVAPNPAAPTPLRTDIRFIRPVVIVNWPAGSGTTELDYVRIDALTPEANWAPFVTRGTCQVSGTTITKQGGAFAWNSDATSIAGHTSCHFVCKTNNAAGFDWLGGLSTNPRASVDWPNVGYAWHTSSAAGNRWQIFEAGVLQVVDAGPIRADDVVAITYDETTIRYYLNDMVTPVRSVVAPGLTLYADVKFLTAGAGINSVRFGPGAILALIDTAQIGNNAATRAFQVDNTGPAAVLVNNGVASNRDWFDYVEVSGLQATDVIEVTASLDAAITAIGTNPSAVIAAAYGVTTPTAAGLGRTKNSGNVADEQMAVVGTFTGLTGTYRFGAEANISHDPAGAISAVTAFNVEIRVTVVRR